jgi:D-psicose/D-tagatose/L-ribulose 3-epimerase
MQIGINLLLWTAKVDERHLPLLERLKVLGYDQVEIPIFEPDPAHYAWLGRELDRIGLARTVVSVRGIADNPVSPDRGVRQAALAAAKAISESAQALGTRLICGPLHSAFGVFSGMGPTEAEIRLAVEHLAEVASDAEPRGISLSLEFLNRFECYLLNTTAQAARMVRAIGMKNVGILYDSFHAHIEERDVQRAIGDHASLINHVHISESDRGTPGKGQVDWTRTFATLKAIGYAGPLVIESFGQGVPEIVPQVKIWRRLFESEEQVARDGLAFIKDQWR